MKREQLRKYAELLVKSGGNVQKGQPVVISCEVRDAEFGRMVMEVAYEVGASEVVIDWRDETVSRARFLQGADEIFDVFPQWMTDKFKFYDETGAAYLQIGSADPDLLKGVEPDRIRRFTVVSRQGTKEHSARVMANFQRWSIVALPSPAWAKKVFPDLEEDKAIEELGKAILKGARADGENPIKDWAAHRQNFEARKKILNEKKFKALRFKNSLGTDCLVGLPKGHIWQGGGDVGQDGLPFFPNQPTEEIFTAPDRNNVNGKVVASLPLSYQGNLIEKFWMVFKDGRAVEYHAEVNETVLKNIIEIDEGSHYLGEVALVPHGSPISQMGILFYNTLFDENASSHLALGKAYPTCIEGGSKMTEEELLSAGMNDSLMHVDFMFGTPDMNVIGIAEDGSETDVMLNGEYVF